MAWLTTFNKALNHEHTPTACLGLFCLLSLMIMWQLIQLALLSPPPLLQTKSFKPSLSITTLATDHLFGFYANSYADLPNTTLSITLAGTEITPHNPAQTLALIATGGTTAAYHAGDKIAGSAVLKAILPARIVIDHDGRLEQAQLPVPTLSVSPIADHPANDAGFST